MIPAYTDPYIDDQIGPPGIPNVAVTNGVHGGGASVLSRISGQVDPHNPETGPSVVVNPREFGITGWGDPNRQQFQSGHSQNVVTNESAEQGWGVGPERAWPHYPTPDNPNPYRNLNVYQRSGTDTYSTLIYRPEVVAYWAQALGLSLSQAPVKQRSPVNPVVNQEPSVPFVTTIAPISPGGY